MTNFIPIFPLEMVVYPGEQVHLHIFEPRYKELIGECVQNGRLFGIPTVIQQKMKDMGTLMEVKEVVQTYENGEMDIRTQGLRIFRILEVIKEVPEKMYSGAIVTYPDNQDDEGNRELMQWVVKGVQELHRMLAGNSPPGIFEAASEKGIAHAQGNGTVEGKSEIKWAFQKFILAGSQCGGIRFAD